MEKLKKYDLKLIIAKKMYFQLYGFEYTEDLPLELSSDFEIIITFLTVFENKITITHGKTNSRTN